jgi:hypothetical protein
MRGAGTGTSDGILSRVSHGEYIVKAAATKEHLPLLEAINSRRLPRFADGAIGPISVLSKGAGQGIGGAPQVNIHAPVTVQGSAGTPEQNASLAKQIGAEFDRIARGVIIDELRTQMRPGNVSNR